MVTDLGDAQMGSQRPDEVAGSRHPANTANTSPNPRRQAFPPRPLPATAASTAASAHFPSRGSGIYPHNRSSGAASVRFCVSSPTWASARPGQTCDSLTRSQRTPASQPASCNARQHATPTPTPSAESDFGWFRDIFSEPQALIPSHLCSKPALRVRLFSRAR